MARSTARCDCGRESRVLRFPDQESDYLGKAVAGDGPRTLPLAARALLVRGAGERSLEWRSKTKYALANREAQSGCGNDPQHAEAGGVHAASSAEQLQRWPGCIRAVLGIGDYDYRVRKGRPGLRCGRGEPGVCRYRGYTVGE